jgi:hypothetical protein
MSSDPDLVELLDHQNSLVSALAQLQQTAPDTPRDVEGPLRPAAVGPDGRQQGEQPT